MRPLNRQPISACPDGPRRRYSARAVPVRPRRTACVHASGRARCGRSRRRRRWSGLGDLMQAAAMRTCCRVRQPCYIGGRRRAAPSRRGGRCAATREQLERHRAETAVTNHREETRSKSQLGARVRSTSRRGGSDRAWAVLAPRVWTERLTCTGQQGTPGIFTRRADAWPAAADRLVNRPARPAAPRPQGHRRHRPASSRWPRGSG